MKEGKNKFKFTMKKNVNDEMPESHQWYKAKFLDANEKEGNYGTMLFLNFQLLDGFMEDGETPAKGRRVSALTSPELSPNSSLYEFIKGMNGGQELDIDDEFDLTSYYGNIFSVFVTCEVSKKSKDGKARVNVKKIKQYKSKKKNTVEKTGKSSKTKVKEKTKTKVKPKTGLKKKSSKK